jgi:glycosyltransferase involved in cell wall biosynthesis
MARTRVLYIQHAGSLGGSCMSLLYTIQGLDPRRFEPIVALARPSLEVRELYVRAGIAVIDAPGIATFEHTALGWTSWQRPTTWHYLLRGLAKWGVSEQRTMELIHAVRPHLVHLNSAVLLQSARALKMHRVPFVWHVREPPAAGLFGARLGLIRAAMRHTSADMIFLSSAERDAWGDPPRAHVVYNFVDFEAFDYTLESAPLRRAHDIPIDAPVILYLGGAAPIKGIFPLLDALGRVLRQYPNVICLMPGLLAPPPRKLSVRAARAVLPLLGSGTTTQRINSMIREYKLESVVHSLPFQTRIAPFMAMSDLVVFPAIRDHFARPAVEAAAMGKPCIASRFPISQEIVRDHHTGLLVAPGDPAALADAVHQLLADPERRSRLGRGALRLARQRFDREKNAAAISQIYEQVLSSESRRPTGDASVAFTA